MWFQDVSVDFNGYPCENQIPGIKKARITAGSFLPAN
jgi:hypothetical protein